MTPEPTEGEKKEQKEKLRQGLVHFESFRSNTEDITPDGCLRLICELKATIAGLEREGSDYKKNFG